MRFHSLSNFFADAEKYTNWKTVFRFSSINIVVDIFIGIIIAVFAIFAI